MADEQFGLDRDRFLEYIRGFAASSVIFALLKEGVLESLPDEFTADDIAQRHAFQPRLCEALFAYLVVEGIVDGQRRGDGIVAYSLTRFGKQIQVFEGWFNLLIGGYRDVFANVLTVLRDGPQESLRNRPLVGIGSCQISRFDALPLALSLIMEVNPAAERIVDVGCGDATFLSDLCDSLPAVSAVGIEPSENVLAEARNVIRTRGLEGRVGLVLSDASSYRSAVSPDFFLFSFVLQEILGQVGEATLIRYLVELRSNFPQARLLVIEVDYRLDDLATLRSPIGLGYYNPYYLLHPLTQQELLPASRWDHVFSESGYRVVLRKLVDPSVDPSGLEFGVILEAV
jgi:2-ketoarginine methyltransferase